ncbi:hypothetical protein [Deinococcus kurensis]|uniref:hypothetical protein n=1 Tax=Deinococcus kurensis TaxID=2662757 RepID=UPI0012D2E163|nr:hypothetical protein [Deinococcus kurensis]
MPDLTSLTTLNPPVTTWHVAALGYAVLLVVSLTLIRRSWHVRDLISGLLCLFYAASWLIVLPGFALMNHPTYLADLLTIAAVSLTFYVTHRVLRSQERRG